MSRLGHPDELLCIVVEMCESDSQRATEPWKCQHLLITAPNVTSALHPVCLDNQHEKPISVTPPCSIPDLLHLLHLPHRHHCGLQSDAAAMGLISFFQSDSVRFKGGRAAAACSAATTTTANLMESDKSNTRGNNSCGKTREALKFHQLLLKSYAWNWDLRRFYFFIEWLLLIPGLKCIIQWFIWFFFKWKIYKLEKIFLAELFS